MDKDLQKLLLVGGLLGLSYLAFTRYSQQKLKNHALSLSQTHKLAQQIKQQMLTVTITFAEGTKDNMASISKQSTKDQTEIVDYFTGKMAQIYEQKQKLILDKYSITKDQYKESLEKYADDKKLQAVKNEIIEMMEKSVRGEMPDLSVDRRAASAFGKAQVRKLYEEMSKMVLVALTHKLRDEMAKNASFDPNNNQHFKIAARDLNAFEKKKQFLRGKGFKQEWGCPNEVYLKLSEVEKAKDPKFKKEMKDLEAIYDKVVDLISQDPVGFRIESIEDHFRDPSPADNKFLSRSAIDHQEQPEHMLYKSSKSESKGEEGDQHLDDDFPDEAPNASHD